MSAGFLGRWSIGDTTDSFWVYARHLVAIFSIPLTVFTLRDALPTTEWRLTAQPYISIGISLFLNDISSLRITRDHPSLHRTKMAIAMSLAFLISFLVIQQISAVSSDIPTPTIKPPVIVTMHVGQPITITQQSQNVTSHIPVFTVCPFGAHTSDNASCATSYQPTVTPICSTTLSPLAAPEIPITACNQKVAFSSNYGFDFAPASGERGYHGPSMSGQEATGTPIPLNHSQLGTQQLIRSRLRE